MGPLDRPGPARAMPDRLLSWAKVRDITGISRTTAWRLQKTGEFPLPVRLSSGRVAWPESEVIFWASSRIRRSPVPGIGRPAPDPAPAPVVRVPAPTTAEPVCRRPRRAPRRRGPWIAEGQITFDF